MAFLAFGIDVLASGKDLRSGKFAGRIGGMAGSAAMTFDEFEAGEFEAFESGPSFDGGFDAGASDHNNW